jgi:putative hydrolase of the HAD superfamily
MALASKNSPAIARLAATLKAISFDAAGTLFELAEPVGETYSRIAAETGLNLTAAALDSGFRTAWRQCATRPLDAVGQEQQRWREIVERTFRQASASAQVSDDLFERLFSHYADGSAWRLFPDTLPALKRCGDRFSLAVVSNFDQRLHRILDDLKIAGYFDCVVISDRVGCRKPDEGIFTAASSALDIRSAEMMHVGDDPACDLQGAQAAGCRAFLLDRPRLTLADMPVD